MSKGDREGFIVKFVENRGKKTEYAVKAYEVNSHYLPLNLLLMITFFATALLSRCLQLMKMFVSCLHRPFWRCSQRNT